MNPYIYIYNIDVLAEGLRLTFLMCVEGDCHSHQAVCTYLKSNINQYC